MIILIDSSQSGQSEFYQNAFKNLCFLVDLLAQQAHKTINWNLWSFFVEADAVQQENGWDCGVFVGLNMVAITKNDPKFPRSLNEKDRRLFFYNVLDSDVDIPESDIHSQSFKDKKAITVSPATSSLQIREVYCSCYFHIADFHRLISNLSCDLCQNPSMENTTKCYFCLRVVHNACLSGNYFSCNCY